MFFHCYRFEKGGFQLKYYVKIGGIYCDHCRTRLTKTISKIDGTQSVTINGNIAIVHSSKDIKEQMIREVERIGYKTKDSWINESFNIWKLRQTFNVLLAIAAIVAVWMGSKRILGFDIFSMIPSIDDSVSLASVFVIGLLTSLHCVGMCGAINLVAATSKKNALIYNAGRVFAYTATGAVVGGLGSVLTINQTFLGAFTVVVALLMLIMGLSMTGLFSLPTLECMGKLRRGSSNAFVLGFLNGFIPCGPLSAMQLYALSTASPVEGGLSMLLFGLGTVPLMLGFGLIRNLFEKKRELVQSIMACFIVVLACSMALRGLSILGIQLGSNSNDLSDYIVAEIDGDIQTVHSELDYGSFGDIAVKAGVPVRFTLHAEGDHITGCNNEIISQDFEFDQKVVEGDNVIEFTPEEPGTYTYTCWMNMIKNTIYVYE